MQAMKGRAVAARQRGSSPERCRLCHVTFSERERRAPLLLRRGREQRGHGLQARPAAQPPRVGAAQPPRAGALCCAVSSVALASGSARWIRGKDA